MASIFQRGKSYHVIYTFEDIDGSKKQKWEAFKTLTEAKRRKTEIEYQQNIGTFTIPSCHTLDELLNEYVNLYGKTVWSLSMYRSNTGLIKNYISPMIGSLSLHEITPHVIERYYQTLLKTRAVPKKTQKKFSNEITYVQPPTIKKIHNLLRSAFNQALKWDMVERNPVTLASKPSYQAQKRDIWDAETLFHAIEICPDERLKLCINLAFACSLRMGEILGLTWDCLDLSEYSVNNGIASLYVNKELQRVDKEALKELNRKDTITVFPEIKANNKTVLILKKPKTESSIRKVFIPGTVAQMLIELKEEQQRVKEAIGNEYSDYNLVICGPFGTPVESSRILDAFKSFSKENDLPPVVFHSLRHTSITYKLKLNGGDIKSVQGDSGHAQAKMVTDQYSHILDDSRVANAQLLEKTFYHGNKYGTEGVYNSINEQASAAGVNPELLTKLLSNPEMVNLLKTLANSL